MDQLTNISASIPAPSPNSEDIAFDSWLSTSAPSSLLYFTGFINTRVITALQAKIDAKDAEKSSSSWVYTLNFVISSEDALVIENCICPAYRKQKWLSDAYNAQYPNALVKMGGYFVTRTSIDDPVGESIVLKMHFIAPPQE